MAWYEECFYRPVDVGGTLFLDKANKKYNETKLSVHIYIYSLASWIWDLMNLCLRQNCFKKMFALWKTEWIDVKVHDKPIRIMCISPFTGWFSQGTSNPSFGRTSFWLIHTCMRRDNFAVRPMIRNDHNWFDFSFSRSSIYELFFVHPRNNDWLVVWLPCFIFPSIGFLIIPIDVHIFQRGKPTTNQMRMFVFLWSIHQKHESRIPGCSWGMRFVHVLGSSLTRKNTL